MASPWIRDRFTLYATALTLLFNLFTWLLLLANVRPSTETITLHYSITFGPDRIGPWYQLGVVPGIGLGIALANVVVSHVRSLDRPGRLTLTVASAVSNAVLLGAMVLVTLANRSTPV